MVAATSTRVDFKGNVVMFRDEQHQHSNNNNDVHNINNNDIDSDKNNDNDSVSIPPTHQKHDVELGLPERAFSAAGAAVVSAIIVNPLDVAKTRLQAQAAGVPYNDLCRMDPFDATHMFPSLRNYPSCSRGINCTGSLCTLESGRYEGTLDVFYKVIRQEGFGRLWRGTYASLALAVPTVGIYLPCYDSLRNLMNDFTSENAPSLTAYVPLVAGSIARSLACISCYPVELARTRMQAFKEIKNGQKPPGVWKTLLGVVNPVRSANGLHRLNNYRILWTGLGAQLARDVPYSAICWSILEPVRRNIFELTGNEGNASAVLGANFSAGFVSGTIAAAATCPLDVAKTRRQIEKDPSRALRMTTSQTLREIWRDGGVKGLFAGIGPRIGRAGPSVGIVVSSYEVVKYALHHRHKTEDGEG